MQDPPGSYENPSAPYNNVIIGIDELAGNYEDFGAAIGLADLEIAGGGGPTSEPFSVATTSTTQSGSSDATYQILPSSGEVIGQPVVITLKCSVVIGNGSDDPNTTYNLDTTPISYSFQYIYNNNTYNNTINGFQNIQPDEYGQLVQLKYASFLAHIGDTFQFGDSLSASGVLDATNGEFELTVGSLLSVGPPADIAVYSASTNDAKNITLSYSITGADLGPPFDVAIYRSPTPTFNINTAVPTGLQATIPATDSDGALSTDQGTHTVTVTLPSAIGPDTSGNDPYVFVVANPPGADHIPESDDPSDTNDVAPLALPYVRVVTLDWDVAKGGVDYITDVIPSNTTAGFYWSPNTTFNPSTDQLITDVTLAGGSTGILSSNLAASSFTVAPPVGTKDLLFVTDPSDQLIEPDETNNVGYLPYFPGIIFLGAKYNGSSSPAVIGRFFADPPTGPPPITDETLTLELSASLAALRPTVNVGNYTTQPKLSSTGSWDGQTYQTEGFDPGTLFDMAMLPTQAMLGAGGVVLAEANSPPFHVVPLPDWILAPEESRPSEVHPGHG